MVNISDKSSYDRVTHKNKRSKLVASCYCSRLPWYYVINAYSFQVLITLLALTLFMIEPEIAERRINGTFTLILTSFSLKIITGKSLPAISYLTTLDKYQFASIFYLALLCIWHSLCIAFKANKKRITEVDSNIYYFFILIYFFSLACLLVSAIISYQKIVKIRKNDKLLVSHYFKYNVVEELINDDDDE